METLVIRFKCGFCQKDTFCPPLGIMYEDVISTVYLVVCPLCKIENHVTCLKPKGYESDNHEDSAPHATHP